MKLTRNIRISILAWVVLFGALIFGLQQFNVDSTATGGILGTFCGATIAAGMIVRERVVARKARGERPPGLKETRYGRR